MEIITNTFFLAISIYSIVSGILIWNSEKTFRRQKNAVILQNRKDENSAQNGTVFLPERVFPCNPRFVEKGMPSNSHENARL